MTAPVEITLTLVAGDDGHHGVITIGNRTWNVRRWRRVGSTGIIKAEATPAGRNHDAEGASNG